MKWNDFNISRGQFSDVNAIYRSLSDKEKEFVTPGRTIYKDVPNAVFARTVARRGEDPAGFVEAYGPYRSPGRNPYFTIETAVADAYRGKGLSPFLARETVKKIVSRIRKNRDDANRRGFHDVKNEPDRIYWDIVNGNDSSAKAALKSGFKKQKTNRYIMSIEDAEKMI